MIEESSGKEPRRSSGRTGLLLGLGIGGLISAIFFVGLLIGMAVERDRAASGADLSDPNLKNFVTAYQLVTKNSYYRPLNQQQLLSAAINGMLKVTGDPHTLFLTAPQSQQSSQALNGSNFTGIGTMVIPEAHALRVWALLPGSPAIKAGLQLDDRILDVDGRPVSGAVSDQAVAAIHGRAGTVVKLTVSRHGGRPFVVPVTREAIQAVTAYGRPLAHHIGYVQITSFGDNTTEDVDAALKQLVADHVHGIILDLRGNPGGFVDAAQQVSSDFIDNGVVAYEQSANKQLTPVPVIQGRRLIHVPVVVLVDDQTASAAEITAAALRDDDHAVLIGRTTYGKGSMQSVYSLPDGSTVRITDRLWLTPKKHSVGGTGLKPNIVVPVSISAADTSLHVAEQYLAQHTSS